MKSLGLWELTPRELAQQVEGAVWELEGLGLLLSVSFEVAETLDFLKTIYFRFYCQYLDISQYVTILVSVTICNFFNI